ncbi:MAG: hypothetical protein AAGD38_02395 [Acidobacteriota bacterium]
MPSRHALHRPVANTYLVRQRDRRLFREMFIIALAVCALGGGLLGVTWIHVEITRMSYTIDDLDQRLHQLLEQERLLRSEAAALAQPARIETRARRDLGLVEPTVEQTVFWREVTR